MCSTLELTRQVDVLVERGYPALAGLTEAAFRQVLAPLQAQLPDEPFVLVVTGAIVPPAVTQHPEWLHSATVSSCSAPGPATSASRGSG